MRAACGRFVRAVAGACARAFELLMLQGSRVHSYLTFFFGAAVYLECAVIEGGLCRLGHALLLEKDRASAHPFLLNACTATTP